MNLYEKIKDQKETYFITEMGQNHNGKLELAYNMIDMVAFPEYFEGEKLLGIQGIKFTKRNIGRDVKNQTELTIESHKAKYLNWNSYAPTYGQHREKLELTYYQHYQLYQKTKSKGLDFIETVCDVKAVDGIERFFLADAYKIASRDICNYSLLSMLSKKPQSIIISTGMSDYQKLQDALKILDRKDIIVLYCVSEYPTKYDNIDFKIILELKKITGLIIGFSDHTAGILAAPQSVMMGAKVIEKHFTLDRTMKGSDHFGSLEYEGLRRVIRDLRNTEKMVNGSGKMGITEGSLENKEKLGRKLVAKKSMKRGHVIKECDIEFRSAFECGLFAEEINNIVGKTILKDVMKGVTIKEADFE